MLAFDPANYFTRRQSDNRYVQSADVTAAYLAGVLAAGGGNILSGSVLQTGTVTGTQIANGAIGLSQMFGTVRPPAIVSTEPTLPDPNFPVGSQIYLTTTKQLMINRNGTSWEPTTRASDLSGTIVASQFASSIKPIQPETSLPTINQDPVSHLPTNFNVGDLIVLTATSKMYQLIDEGGFNYVWDPVVKGTNIDTTSGLISASQIDVDAVLAATVSSGYLKTSVEDAGIITVDQLGANNATIDNLAGANIEATLANFTTINGDSANIGFVTAGMVVAGAINSTKLLIGSFDNLMEDGGVENAASVGSWIPDGHGLAVGSGYAHSGNQSLVKSSSTASTIVNRMVFAVKGADLSNPDTMYLEGWVKAFSSANGTAHLQVQYFVDRACTTPVSPTLDLAIPSSSAASWYYNNTSGAVPSGARWARTAVYITGQTAGVWSVDDLYVRTMIGQAYINSLSANVINSGILNCANITVQNLSATSLSTGVLTVGGTSVTAASIAGLDASNNNILWIGKSGSNYGIWAENAWFGGTGPSNAPISCISGVVSISGSVIVGAVSSATSASTASTATSASSVPASGVGNGALNAFTTIAGNQITTGTIYVGGTGAPGNLYVRDSGNNNIGWVGYVAGCITAGGWFQSLGIGGPNSGNPYIYCDSSGNAFFTGNITAHTLDISSATITGTLSASAISGGTLDCNHISVSNLSVQTLTGWSGGAIDVGSFVQFGNSTVPGSGSYVQIGSSGINIYNGYQICSITGNSFALTGNIQASSFYTVTGAAGITMSGTSLTTQSGSVGANTFAVYRSGWTYAVSDQSIQVTVPGGTKTLTFYGGILVGVSTP